MHAHLTAGDLTKDQVDYYINSLVNWITATIHNGDKDSIEAIRSLWDDESWESIQEKLLTEASTWHVWWMDGVRKYIAIWLPDAAESTESGKATQHG